jgi:DNA-binding transcriptional LysR family regulator
MKLDEIEAFVAVVGSQSLNQAADALSLTQPAVTRRLQNFEERLRVELLDRNNKPLRPTPIGRVVYEQCRVILHEVEVLRTKVNHTAPLAGVLRAGVAQTVADVAMLDGLQAIREAHPDVKVRVSTGWGEQLIQKVEAGELDAALVLLPTNRTLSESLASEELGRIELVVVAQKGQYRRRTHSLAACQSVGWVLNPDGCGFRSGLQRALAAQGYTLQLNMETLGTELQLGLVADGVGLGLVPLPLLEKSVHAPQLDIVTLSDFKPDIAVRIVHTNSLGKMRAALDVLAHSVRGSFGDRPLARVA